MLDVKCGNLFFPNIILEHIQTDLHPQADQLLIEKADERDQKRLEKTEVEKRHVSSERSASVISDLLITASSKARYRDCEKSCGARPARLRLPGPRPK